MFQYRNIFPARGRGSIISQTSLRSYARVWLLEWRLQQALAQALHLFPLPFPVSKHSESERKRRGVHSVRLQEAKNSRFIAVGLMKNRKTFMRGKRLPVKLMSSATARTTPESCKEHAAYNKRFHAGEQKHAAYKKRFRAGEYRLVYKDGSDVDVIPGTGRSTNNTTNSSNLRYFISTLQAKKIRF